MQKRLVKKIDSGKGYGGKRKSEIRINEHHINVALGLKESYPFYDSAIYTGRTGRNFAVQYASLNVLRHNTPSKAMSDLLAHNNWRTKQIQDSLLVKLDFGDLEKRTWDLLSGKEETPLILGNKIHEDLMVWDEVPVSTPTPDFVADAEKHKSVLGVNLWLNELKLKEKL